MIATAPESVTAMKSTTVVPVAAKSLATVKASAVMSPPKAVISGVESAIATEAMTTGVAAAVASASVSIVISAVATSIAAAITPVSIVAIVVSAVATVRSATTVVAAPVIALIPGTDSNKHAANKVGGPVIAIGCTGIRVILVVAVRADRFRSDIGVVVIVGVIGVGRVIVGGIRLAVIRILRRRFWHAEKQDPTQQCKVFQVGHDFLNSDSDRAF